MKKQFMILAALAFAASAMAQTTNELGSLQKKKPRPENREQAGEKHSDRQQRRLPFMERELRKIGITKEEKAQIIELQKKHKEKMASNAREIALARKNLSLLQDDGASMEELEAAIQEVSVAQTEQLRILVHNRIEMERILGKEKYALFMQNARKQFKKHGRRNTPPLPPRPGFPPIPGQENPHRNPPVPAPSFENRP
ncbi:MAG: hypothetical protein ABFR47_07510 [Verrucomicrobiota bacterium]